MNNWVPFAILAGLFSSIFNYGYRYVLKIRDDSTIFSWWFELLRTTFVLFILPFDFKFELSVISILLFIGIGLVEFFSVYLYSKMHKANDLSISTIILRLRVVWIPIFAFVLFGEKLLGINYLGVLVVFLGLSFVTSPKKLFYDHGMLVAFYCSILTAILAVMIKQFSLYASTSVVLVAMGLPSLFLFPLLMSNWKIRMRDFCSPNLYGVIIVAASSVVSAYFQIYALRLGTVTQVMGVFQAMSLTTVLAGIFLLDEKDNLWKKIIGSLIVIFGAMLLF